MPENDSVQRRLGRPRDPRADGLILESAVRLISREGYSRTSLQAVAAEAGVSTATIHLRWNTKMELVTAALGSVQLDLPEDTGDTSADLLAQLHWFKRTAQRISTAGLVGACLVEEQNTPELLQLLRERAAQPRLKRLNTILRLARKRGEIDPSADLEAATRLLFGVFYADYIPGRTEEDLDARAVELVLRSLGFTAV
jgi:AcrR family transcriptional regulator